MPIHRLRDSRLIRRSQQGDRDAFLVLAKRYDPRLRGLAHALVGRDATAKVLRVAYLKAWRDVVRLGVDDDAGSWLYRIAYNACVDEMRREQLRLDGPERRERPAAADPVEAALLALPPEQRVAVVLVDREGFSREAASRILGVPPD
ncbi:MAG TPA: sigma factor, partial [Acidimicrobiales bacterium]